IANFFNATGRMIGVDTHPYAGPDNKPKDTPHFVSSLLKHGDKLTGTVFADGQMMVNESSKVKGVVLLHIPLTKEKPGSAEASLAIKMIKAAQSASNHGCPTVYGEGHELAMAFLGDIGVNNNCGSDPYTNIVNNPCTVKTKAIVDQMVRNVAHAWLDKLIGF